jgi:hypothetical protein
MDGLGQSLFGLTLARFLGRTAPNCASGGHDAEGDTVQFPVAGSGNWRYPRTAEIAASIAK